MSSLDWDELASYGYEVRDITSGATVARGLVYPYEKDHLADLTVANSYIFKPPVALKPGLMVLIRG